MDKTFEELMKMLCSEDEHEPQNTPQPTTNVAMEGVLKLIENVKSVSYTKDEKEIRIEIVIKVPEKADVPWAVSTAGGNG